MHPASDPPHPPRTLCVSCLSPCTLSLGVSPAPHALHGLNGLSVCPLPGTCRPLAPALHAMRGLLAYEPSAAPAVRAPPAPVLRNQCCCQQLDRGVWRADKTMVSQTMVSSPCPTPDACAPPGNRGKERERERESVCEWRERESEKHSAKKRGANMEHGQDDKASRQAN